MGVHSPHWPVPKQTPPLPQTAVPCHTPLGSQVCGMLPVGVHCLAPGLHMPAQLPVAHRKGQSVPFVHLPLASQVCGVRPVHCFEPGTHMPPHCPVAHTKGQVWLSIHCACWLQSCCVLPLHRVVPGVQTPVH